MKKIITIIIITLSGLILSCSNKADRPQKISKEEYANDIARYVTIEYCENGGYAYEKNGKYILTNDTEYTLDNVIVEFDISVTCYDTITYIPSHGDYSALLEFNYIKAKDEKLISHIDMIKALNPSLDVHLCRASVKAFKIKKIKSTALKI